MGCKVRSSVGFCVRQKMLASFASALRVDVREEIEDLARSDFAVGKYVGCCVQSFDGARVFSSDGPKVFSSDGPKVFSSDGPRVFIIDGAKVLVYA